jgi:dUTP pyrophosphatase
MEVRVKKLHENAVVPQYSKSGDAGLDLTAISAAKDGYGNMVYGTGLAIEIPEGHVGLLFPRSSNSKTDLYLTNHVGVIDSGYRGEVILKFRPRNTLLDARIHHPGDRVGQLMIIPYPQVKLVESEELSDTVRGDGGFGSTGK